MAKTAPKEDALNKLKLELRNKELGRLYVFHGEELFLLEHYLGQVKKLLLDPLTESFNYHRFHTENFDAAAFDDAVEGLPMMAEHTPFRWSTLTCSSCRKATGTGYPPPFPTSPITAP